LGDDINGKVVDVRMDYLAADKTFKVTSVGKSADSSTTIDAYLPMLDFSGLLENVITSTNEVTLQPGVTVTPLEKIVDDYPVEDWPSDADFIAYYRSQVEDAPHYVGDTIIEFNSDTEIGPLYVDGDLTLRSKKDDVTLTLNGTVYVTGTLTTDQNKTFTLDFNGETIFVESNAPYPTGAIKIGSKKTSVAGSGCIIAVGGINFGPNVPPGSPEDFLFVMSINDTTFAHPNGTFNGSFAGKVEVQLQPGDVITWNDPEDNDLNFPGASLTNWMLNIDTWDIELD
jgi:hypothetical protein